MRRIHSGSWGHISNNFFYLKPDFFPVSFTILPIVVLDIVKYGIFNNRIRRIPFKMYRILVFHSSFFFQSAILHVNKTFHCQKKFFTFKNILGLCYNIYWSRRTHFTTKFIYIFLKAQVYSYYRFSIHCWNKGDYLVKSIQMHSILDVLWKHQKNSWQIILELHCLMQLGLHLSGLKNAWISTIFHCPFYINA